MKKFTCILLVFAAVLFATNSLAGWGNFYVKSAGAYESSAYPEVGSIDMARLQPADGGDGIYFRVNASKSSEILATALTALSSGKPVRANIEDHYDNGHWSDYVIMSLFIGDSLSDLE